MWENRKSIFIFCTECGWKSESQEIQTDYKAVRLIEKSELHADEKATSIDRKLISRKTKMADIIMDNQSAKRKDVSESSDRSGNQNQLVS